MLNLFPFFFLNNITYATIVNSEVMFDLCVGSDVVCNDEFFFQEREFIWLILKNYQIV